MNSGGEAGIARLVFAHVVVLQAMTLTIKDLGGYYSFIFFCLFLSDFVFFSHRWTQIGHKSRNTNDGLLVMPKVGADN